MEAVVGLVASAEAAGRGWCHDGDISCWNSCFILEAWHADRFLLRPNIEEHPCEIPASLKAKTSTAGKGRLRMLVV